MNNEIKEILDDLKFTNKDVMWCDKITLNVEQSHLLLDYITNLQQIEQQYSAILSENVELENKITNLQRRNNNLKEDFKRHIDRINELTERNDNLQQENYELNRMCELYGKSLYYAELKDYKSRCEKASEYINKEFKDEPYSVFIYGKTNIDNLLNILQNGSDSQ